MKALVYTNPNEMQLLERPYPESAEGEVVLRIDAVGICGTDLHAYHGHDPRRKPGLVMGHEFAGTVADGPRTGRRVTGNPLIACGVCDYCEQGRNNLCSNRTAVGMTRPGAFAEYMSIPAQCLIELPDGMSALRAALAEPAATALHAVNLSMRALCRPLPECRTLVLGGGAIGLLCALLLRSYGARDVVLAETNPMRRASAERHAGCMTYDPGAAAATSSAFDHVIDAVGAKGTRNAALAAIKPGGVILHIGLQDQASEIDMRRLTLAEIALIGTYGYTTADLRTTVAALHNNVFGDLAWVEGRRLDDGAAAFADLHHGRTAAAKVVLQPH